MPFRQCFETAVKDRSAELVEVAISGGLPRAGGTPCNRVSHSSANMLFVSLAMNLILRYSIQWFSIGFYFPF